MTNILDFFSSFTLKLKNQHTFHLTHLYADYVELVSLFSNDNYISITDFLDRLSDEGIDTPNVDDIDRAGENDKRETFGNKVFSILEERANIYNTAYPYIFHNRLIKLKPKSNLSNKNKVYILLLLSSNLDIFQNFNNNFTTDFETISTHVLKAYLPDFAIVKSLGSNSDYQGYTIEKIRELAIDMDLEVDEAGLSHISKNATKEKGLDIIGWIPSHDRAGNILTLLCQCACGKKWANKQNESKRYLKYLKFNGLTPISVMFIPYALASNNISSFYQNDDIHEQLIFERKRIINFLNDASFFNNLISKEIIDYIIDFEEDIV